MMNEAPASTFSFSRFRSSVGLGALGMFFRIAGHTDTEARVPALFDLSVDELPAIHPADLCHQFGGVPVSVGQVFEGVFTPYVVTPQGQYIVNVEEVESRSERLRCRNATGLRRSGGERR